MDNVNESVIIVEWENEGVPYCLLSVALIEFPIMGIEGFYLVKQKGSTRDMRQSRTNSRVTQ